MMLKLTRFLSRYKLQFAGAVILAVSTVVCGIALMSFSGLLISRAALQPMLVDLFMITAAVRFFGISRAVVRYFDRLVSHDLTFRVLCAMRGLLYRAIDRASLHWIMGKRQGDLMARLVADIDMLQNVYLRVLIPSIVAAILVLLVFFALWIIHPVLAFACLGFHMTAGVLVPCMAHRYSKSRNEHEVSTRSRMKEFLVDRVQGLQDVLWLNQVEGTNQTLENVQNELDAIQHARAGASGFIEGLNSILAHLGTLTVLFLAAPFVLEGTLQGPWLAMVVLGVLSSFEAVQGLGVAYLNLHVSKEAADRYFGVADQPVTPQEPDQISTPPAHTDIEFREVSFAYLEDHVTVRDINLHISRGAKVAIVGPTGSGKSTLVNLLTRNWDVSSGQILLDGIDITRYKPKAARSCFSVIAQDAHVFNRSLRENLLLAKPSAIDQELSDTLCRVGLERFADDLSRELGSQGMKLSGGERQMLSLARGLLRDAPVWILDEPSANLDVHTERKVFDTIWAHAGTRTMLLISHRLIDMEKIDQIIVMDKGRMVEKGTHANLISSDTLYAGLYYHQSRLVSL